MHVNSPLTECDIIDWWEGARHMIDNECRLAHEAIIARAYEGVEALSDRDLFSPVSMARKAIRRRIVSDVNILNRRLATSLRDSLAASISRIEATQDNDAPDFTDTAVLAAGGMLAVGSVGLAMTAGSLATAGSVVFFIPVATVFWPAVAMVGSVAVGAAWMSPKLLKFATARARTRLRAGFAARVYNLVLSDANPKTPVSTASVLKAKLDEVVRLRLQGIYQ